MAITGARGNCFGGDMKAETPMVNRNQDREIIAPSKSPR